MADVNDINELRSKLKRMSPEERARLHKLISSAPVSEAPAVRTNSGNRWFDRPITGLNAEGMAKLKELEKRLNNDMFMSARVDMKQVNYLKKLKKMKLQVPSFFRNTVDPRRMYQHLRSFCINNDIPEEIITRVVPALVTYIETGHMRPIILVGEKGCGKTTALRMLVEEALQLHTEIIKVPQADGSHGITGHCGSFYNADVGLLSRARFKSKKLLNAYVFDEIDKVTHSQTHASIDDELLSITDESNDSIVDNYLDTTIVGLEYCPMFFTANDLTRINPILVDRCTVIRFPNANKERIKAIMAKYVNNKLSGTCYKLISIDMKLMNKYIDILVDHDVTSLRKHQQLIEIVLQNALNVALTSQGNDKTEVTEQMFREASEAILGIEKHKIGFAA
ncbi:MAG: AAA family ATPase [Clostridiales bacterium]|nr:AAA family ATPase [Clostridiales bacterium]